MARAAVDLHGSSPGRPRRCRRGSARGRSRRCASTGAGTRARSLEVLHRRCRDDLRSRRRGRWRRRCAAARRPPAGRRRDDRRRRLGRRRRHDERRRCRARVRGGDDGLRRPRRRTTGCGFGGGGRLDPTGSGGAGGATRLTNIGAASATASRTSRICSSAPDRDDMRGQHRADHRRGAARDPARHGMRRAEARRSGGFFARPAACRRERKAGPMAAESMRRHRCVVARHRHRARRPSRTDLYFFSATTRSNVFGWKKTSTLPPFSSVPYTS